METIRESADLLWKEIIKDMFPEFLEFFLPEIYKETDFTKGYEFLDKELENIAFKIRKGRNLADKLIKIYTKDSEEKWLLIHVEVQGQAESEFSERMFRYFYRLYDEYGQKISAIEIFTDTNENYCPKEYNYECYETKLTYQYKSYKVIKQDEKELTESENPFALVVLAAYYTAKTEGKNKENERYIFKKKLARILFKKEYSREKIVKILRFIESLIFVNEEYEKAFINDLKEIIGGEDEVIPIELTNAYQVGVYAGIEKGIEKGIEQGIIKGMEKGIEKGMEKGIIFTAKKLIEMGLDFASVKEATGLSDEEIKKLQNTSLN